MNKITLCGVIGILAAGGLVALPAEAQLKDITDAAGKLAERVAGAVSGTATSPTTVTAAPNATADKSARITILDKQTNRRQKIVLVAGEPQTAGTIQVQLTRCISDHAAVLGQDVAWLDVTESAEGNGRSAPWFSGWMFNTYPEISTLDHPRYDVQVQGCGVKERQVVKASGSAPVIESNEPIVDTETTATTGADGNDPYLVPGVGAGSAQQAPAQPDGGTVAPASAQEPAAVKPADTETPQASAPVEQPATGGEQQDLHQMMDGTY